MRIILLFFALCLASGCKSPHTEETMPPGIIDLTNADAYQVLDIYSRLTGMKVVKDSQVRAMESSAHIVLRNTNL